MTPGQREEGSLKEKLRSLHEQVAKRWEIALANDGAAQIARDYLAKRGVSDEAVRRFRMGYAPDKWDDTLNWAKSKNTTPSCSRKAASPSPGTRATTTGFVAG